VDALAGRRSPDNGLMTITDAYTGLRRTCVAARIATVGRLIGMPIRT
jgi:hypothetical protein